MFLRWSRFKFMFWSTDYKIPSLIFQFNNGDVAGYAHIWEFELFNGKYGKILIMRHRYVRKWKSKFVFGKENKIKTMRCGFFRWRDNSAWMRFVWRDSPSGLCYILRHWPTKFPTLLWLNKLTVSGNAL